MMNRRIFGLFALGLLWASVVSAQPAQSSATQTALELAASNHEHLFILLHKTEDAATKTMQATLRAGMQQSKSPARGIMVNVQDPRERPFLDQWKLSRVPTPMVLAVAPNGAITGAFPLKLTEANVNDSIVGPMTARCLKAVQDRKLVLLCVLPNEGGIPEGVKQFQADPEYAKACEIVAIRQGDQAEKAFLAAMKLEEGTHGVKMLLPSGAVAQMFALESTKEQLKQALKNASSSCCPGGKCGPGGCCSPKK
jgi:hypothetical protein